MDSTDTSRVAELRTSARGWHGVQLAVLGFIGLCGVLQRGHEDLPRWLQVLAAVLVLIALAVACVATVLVALAAWPVYAKAPMADDQAEIRRTVGRLRIGIGLTFVAVALTALATTSQWWPTKAESGSSALVQVSTANGEVCGQLQQIDTSGITLNADGQDVSFAFGDVISLQSVPSC
ncbi:MAG TPA: hypothetical protein VKB55_10440 [Nocardioidaceae bacterium]|nr:hypothetical protein [Nocardioidaceae bacterium]